MRVKALHKHQIPACVPVRLSTDWNFEIENGSMVKVLWKWKHRMNTRYQLVCQWDWAQTGILKLKMTAWSKSYESERTAAVVGSL